MKNFLSLSEKKKIEWYKRYSLFCKKDTARTLTSFKEKKDLIDKVYENNNLKKLQEGGVIGHKNQYDDFLTNIDTYLSGIKSHQLDTNHLLKVFELRSDGKNKKLRNFLIRLEALYQRMISIKIYGEFRSFKLDKMYKTMHGNPFYDKFEENGLNGIMSGNWYDGNDLFYLLYDLIESYNKLYFEYDKGTIKTSPYGGFVRNKESWGIFDLKFQYNSLDYNFNVNEIEGNSCAYFFKKIQEDYRNKEFSLSGNQCLDIIQMLMIQYSMFFNGHYSGIKKYPNYIKSLEKELGNFEPFGTMRFGKKRGQFGFYID